MVFDPEDVETLLQAKFDPSAATTEAAFQLSVTEGPDRGATLKVDATTPPLFVGQSPVSALRLTDRAVSRRHVSIEVVRDRLHLRDLESTNGTRVDGVAVEGAWLLGGETLRIGSTVIRVARSTDAHPTALPGETRFGRVFGASAPMRRLYPLCRRLAAFDVPVIIEGETGTGKEVLAESIHDEGPRRAGPFVVFDCTAVSPSLMEAELFGHERGAFTGAVGQRKGLFEQASGGTLLIDEIGDLEAPLQPKLLRAVERAEIRRVGGDRAIRVDVRILAATRRDLDREVQEGRFRDDLFHRLAVARIELPPLRERTGDVAELATHFWHALGGGPAPLDPTLLAQWQRAPWPGNVRELRNAVARHLALGELGDLDASVSVARPTTGSDFIDDVIARDLPLATGRAVVAQEYERRHIEALVQRHGSVGRAAEASGLARRHFQRLRARARKS